MLNTPNPKVSYNSWVCTKLGEQHYPHIGVQMYCPIFTLCFYQFLRKLICKNQWIKIQLTLNYYIIRLDETNIRWLLLFNVLKFLSYTSSHGESDNIQTHMAFCSYYKSKWDRWYESCVWTGFIGYGHISWLTAVSPSFKVIWVVYFTHKKKSMSPLSQKII